MPNYNILECSNCASIYDLEAIRSVHGMEFVRRTQEKCPLCSFYTAHTYKTKTARPYKIVEKRTTVDCDIKSIFAKLLEDNKTMLDQNMAFIMIRVNQQLQEMEKKMMQDLSDLIISYKEEEKSGIVLSGPIPKENIYNL